MMIKSLHKFIILLLVLIGCFGELKAQEAKRFNLSIAYGMSKTGSLTYSEQYLEIEGISSTINILTTTQARNSNYNFSIGFQPSRSISINGSIGVASYGFQYTGDVVASPTNTLSVGGFVAREVYSTRLMEVGFAISYRYSFSEFLTFFVQPGLAWYTNPRDDFQQLFGINLKSNNYAASFGTGLETPLIDDVLFISLGFNAKIALNDFGSRGTEDINSFRPFAFGLQTSITYRFGAFKNGL
ncbi:MAG: hypothetical protein AAGA77_01470 [Bacteroidota bacterium]